MAYFNWNLGIKVYIDLIADIEKFFDYMDLPKIKRVKLAAFRLMRSSSTWQERL